VAEYGHETGFGPKQVPGVIPANATRCSCFVAKGAVASVEIGRLPSGEAVGLSVSSAAFKTLLVWLENSFRVTVRSCC
jgi:hypothetical protein